MAREEGTPDRRYNLREMQRLPDHRVAEKNKEE